MNYGIDEIILGSVRIEDDQTFLDCRRNCRETFPDFDSCTFHHQFPILFLFMYGKVLLCPCNIVRKNLSATSNPIEFEGRISAPIDQ